MALELDSRYPGRFNPGDADYPQGSFKNRTAPGALDGSYLEQDWANDKEGFFQRLLQQAGISANGFVDSALASQYYDALLQVISDNETNFLNTTRIDVASASTIDLTVAAPNTRHINITGTTSITGFTIEVGKCYFIRFADSLTLTNGASLVTNVGTNVVTAAGSTCILRATADDVVEILMYTRGPIQQSLGTSGYLIHEGGLIEQWGSRTAGPTLTGTVTFPLAFPTQCFNVVAVDHAIDSATIASMAINAAPTAANFTFYTTSATDGGNFFWVAKGR